MESWPKVLSSETGRKGQVPFYTLFQSLRQVAQLSVKNVQLVRNKKDSTTRLPSLAVTDQLVLG